ncbi:hypothetical protein [Exiguobacterium artemiae]|uniref:hypothetical protein n=1 Tax=Exiguobacterium artemiae TaxID=340145 RepID=UPI0029652085|nr:hypothetical protein [Exiguobacterium sibiricum]MDW2886747.1 hypothetical protein [Exiguobacterium sibiricum]
MIVKTFLFYVMTTLLVIVIVAKFMVPLFSWWEQEEPSPVSEKARTTLRLDEGQLKQFDREDRVGVTYEMAGLKLKTLDVAHRDTTRQTPLLLINVQKEKLLQVMGEPNRLLAITVKITNQSADTIQIMPKIGEYETKGKIITIADQFNSLNGSYKPGESRIGIVFIPSSQVRVTEGRLSVFYQTMSGEKQLRIALNE